MYVIDKVTHTPYISASQNKKQILLSAIHWHDIIKNEEKEKENVNNFI